MQGDLFILDGENTRIVKFAAGTTFERTFGGLNRAEAKLQSPIKLVVLPSGMVYVAETQRILVYDAYGNFVKALGEGVCSGLVGFDATEERSIAVSNDRVWLFDSDGTLLQAFSRSAWWTETPMREMTDIALTHAMIYVLTPETVHCFKNSLK
jgi:hypothetical protein